MQFSMKREKNEMNQLRIKKINGMELESEINATHSH